MKAYSAPGMIAAGRQKDPVLEGILAMTVAVAAALAIGIVSLWLWVKAEE